MSQISPSSSGIAISQVELDEINKPQQADLNSQCINDKGGVKWLLSAIGVDAATGLSDEQLAERKEKFGVNTLPEKPMKGFLTLFFEAFSDFTIMILICAAVVSLAIGIWEEPHEGWIEGTAILIAVFIVANVTAGNDYTKELQFRALEESSKRDVKVLVRRNDATSQINPEGLTVGDIIELLPGDGVPADSVMIENDLEIMSNESALTGESEPVKKSTTHDPFLLSSCTITDSRKNVRAVVIGIGRFSQWGRIREKLIDEPGNTPLQDKLDNMAKQIGSIGMCAAVATFIALIVSHAVREEDQSSSAWITTIIEAFIYAVTIVVVAIPEGLPLAVTISLAYSTKRMYQDQNMIRVLSACETMGNATSICSDKTGTLTENRMTVVEGYFGNKTFSQDDFRDAKSNLHGSVASSVVENSCINRLAVLIDKDEQGVLLYRPRVKGSATEGALLMMSRSWGFPETDVIRENFNEANGDVVFAFNSLKKRSTAIIKRQDGSVRVYVKGATEWVLKDCTHYQTEDGRTEPVGKPIIDFLTGHIEAMANRALRTLCLAHRDFPSIEALPANWHDSPPDTERLCVDAIVGIIDPLREDVKEAVLTAQRAGVVVRMVTGDNINTAKAIARQCGILNDEGLAMEGPVFRNLTPSELDKILPRLQVLARSSPDDKFLLVTRLNGKNLPKNREEWEEKNVPKGFTWDADKDRILPGYREEWEMVRPDGGQVIGVTGDGTNDAPALKAADVGLSMGITGTQVAKDASAIVILDDKFSSIVRAIKWGRCVYDNIRKFLQFQLTVNMVALAIVFIGAVAGFEPPLNPVMMLWVNLIMDTMGALALGTEGPTESLLNRRPYKRGASLISRPMWRNILFQSTFQLILMITLLFDGARLFGVPIGNYCSDWNFSDNANKIIVDDISCAEAASVCNGDSDCIAELTDSTIEHVAYECDGICEGYDYRHFTIIFNTFVFAQLFNEINARSIKHDVNVFSGLFKNHIFITVIFVTMAFQILIVEFGSDFTKTSPIAPIHWIITVGLALISFPVGVAMRFFTVDEDEQTFADSMQITFDPKQSGSADVESIFAKTTELTETKRLIEKQED